VGDGGVDAGEERVELGDDAFLFVEGWKWDQEPFVGIEI